MKNVIVSYDPELLKVLRDHRIVLQVDSLDAIEHQYRDALQNNEVIAVVANLPYTSVSQIGFANSWEDIPLIIKAYNIGDYCLLLQKADIIKRLNIRLLLSSLSDTIYTDLKILASVGIDCGIVFEEGVLLDDNKLLDLASYYYMSPVPHATIEPFEFILRHANNEEYESFRSVYFDNPSLYTRISTIDDIESIEDSDDKTFQDKLHDYYNHFLCLDNCSKCPAFRICDHNMESKLSSCQCTMNEIFEYAENRNEINNRLKPKTICQL
jgi:hypothetical protein